MHTDVNGIYSTEGQAWCIVQVANKQLVFMQLVLIVWSTEYKHIVDEEFTGKPLPKKPFTYIS